MADRFDALGGSPGCSRRLAPPRCSRATGRVLPATHGETRSYRIFMMLQQGMGLSEVESLVAAIFKVPMATAKRIVNAAVARYSVELDEGLGSAIRESLETATWTTKESLGTPP
jgi:hypothetical protein